MSEGAIITFLLPFPRLSGFWLIRYAISLGLLLAGATAWSVAGKQLPETTSFVACICKESAFLGQDPCGKIRQPNDVSGAEPCIRALISMRASHNSAHILNRLENNPAAHSISFTTNSARRGRISVSLEAHQHRKPRTRAQLMSADDSRKPIYGKYAEASWKPGQMRMLNSALSKSMAVEQTSASKPNTCPQETAINGNAGRHLFPTKQIAEDCTVALSEGDGYVSPSSMDDSSSSTHVPRDAAEDETKVRWKFLLNCLLVAFFVALRLRALRRDKCPPSLCSARKSTSCMKLCPMPKAPKTPRRDDDNGLKKKLACDTKIYSMVQKCTCHITKLFGLGVCHINVSDFRFSVTEKTSYANGKPRNKHHSLDSKNRKSGIGARFMLPLIDRFGPHRSNMNLDEHDHGRTCKYTKANDKQTSRSKHKEDRKKNPAMPVVVPCSLIPTEVSVPDKAWPSDRSSSDTSPSEGNSESILEIDGFLLKESKRRNRRGNLKSMNPDGEGSQSGSPSSAFPALPGGVTPPVPFPSRQGKDRRASKSRKPFFRKSRQSEGVNSKNKTLSTPRNQPPRGVASRDGMPTKTPASVNYCMFMNQYSTMRDSTGQVKGCKGQNWAAVARRALATCDAAAPMQKQSGGAVNRHSARDDMPKTSLLLPSAAFPQAVHPGISRPRRTQELVFGSFYFSGSSELAISQLVPPPAKAPGSSQPLKQLSRKLCDIPHNEPQNRELGYDIWGNHFAEITCLGYAFDGFPPQFSQHRDDILTVKGRTSESQNHSFFANPVFLA